MAVTLHFPSVLLILWVAIPALSAMLYAYLLSLHARKGWRAMEPAERWLVVFLLSAALWSLISMWAHAMPVGDPVATALVRGLAVANYALPLSVYGFVAHFLALRRAQRFVPLGLAGYAAVSALTVMGWVVHEAHVEAGLIYQSLGPGIAVVALYWVALMYTATYYVLREWRRTEHPDFRVRLTYLLGTCIALIIGNTLNVVLGAYPVDQLFAAAAAVLMALNLGHSYPTLTQRAIVRGILLIAAALAYVVVFASTVYIIAHLAAGAAVLASITLAVVTVFLLMAYTPTRQRVIHWLDRYLFDEGNFAALLYQLTEVGSRLQLPQHLGKELLRRITATLPIREAALLIRDDLKGVYEVVAAEGLPEAVTGVTFQPDSPLVRILGTYDHALTVEELAELPQAHGLWVQEWDALKALKAEVLLPIKVEQDLVGFFTFGRHVNGVPFSQRALRHWFPHLARHVALMVENSRLYAQVQAEAHMLARVNEELQELNRMKTHLLQNVSHDLRTPLTLIIGYADLLRQRFLTSEEQVVEAGEVIRQNAEHLLHLVEQLLSFQRLEAKPIPLEPFDLRSFLYQVGRSWQPTMEAAKLKLVLDIADDVGWARGHPDYLRQVVDNLLSNARKFSPEGGTVFLRAWRDGDTVYVSVQDEGIGIPPDKLERIFERFYQVEGSSGRKHGGMGIGLALCKEIVERHGGRIWAESEGEGKGAKFTFTLQAIQPQPQTDTPHDSGA